MRLSGYTTVQICVFRSRWVLYTCTGTTGWPLRPWTSALEIMADHRSMIGKNLAVICKKSPLVIRMIGRNFFPSNLRASYFFFLLLSSFPCRVYFESRTNATIF